jgi:hypothetical protein
MMSLNVSPIPKGAQISSNNNALNNGVKKGDSRSQDSIKSTDGDTLMLSPEAVNQITNHPGNAESGLEMEIEKIIGENLCQFLNADSSWGALMETTAQNMANILNNNPNFSEADKNNLMTAGNASRNYLIENTAQKIYETLKAKDKLLGGSKREVIEKDKQLIDDCFKKEMGSSPSHSTEETYFFNAVYDKVMQKLSQSG